MSLKYICDKCGKTIVKEFYQLSAVHTSVGEQEALKSGKPIFAAIPADVGDFCTTCYRKIRRDLTGEAI